MKEEGTDRPKRKKAEKKRTHQILSMTKGCIRDYRCLLVSDALVSNMSSIVGYNVDGTRVKDTEVHDKLVSQGKAWAAHINEPWHALIWSGVYILVSVTLGIPVFSVIANIVVAIIRAGGADLADGTLAFSFCYPSSFLGQSPAWIVFGLIVQALDAVLYIYIGKIIAKSARLIYGRPLDARLGKRSLVIVDTPAVHQMLENFVSKLFSMSYSVVSIDVHGASGLDHFVHRFTHRVSRGSLIAVGRPDGRLCCLSKSESSILLSIKQAVFIRNPAYARDGSGPDIISVGHNPFIPNLGVAQYVTIGQENNRSTRRQFLDEYLFDKLFQSPKPDGSAMLHYIRDLYENITTSLLTGGGDGLSATFGISGKGLDDSMHSASSVPSGTSLPARPVFSRTSASMMEDLKSNIARTQTSKSDLHILPYGLHHVPKEPASFATVLRGLQLQRALREHKKDAAGASEKADDPEKRLIFSQRLDALSRRVQASQQALQHLYEGRIASIERYIAFCVVFYHMAKDCCNPTLLKGWDITRSQSNLRVATTASPIPASAEEGAIQTRETVRILGRLAHKLRGFTTHH